MTNSTTLPAPYGGVNNKIPVAALKNPFCEDLLNFNVTQAGISLRNGDSKYSSMSFTTNTKTALAIGTYGDSEAFLAVRTTSPSSVVQIYDITNLASPVFTSAVLGSLPDTVFPLYFNQRLYFFFYGASNLGYVYDGSAWALIGYTGITGLGVSSAASFNHRIYLVDSANISGDYGHYYYGNLDAVTGALTRVPLASIIEEAAYIKIIAPVTVSNNAENRSYLAFVFSSGEVLFYSGSYPDSANWSLAARAKIGAPLGPNACISYQGDRLVLCDNGVVSLRDLFLQGSEAAINLSVNANIQRKWIDMVAASPSLGGPGSLYLINGVWDKRHHRIVIPFPYYLDSDGAAQSGGFFFIFDTLFQSWAYHQSYGVEASDHKVQQAVYFQSEVLLLSSDAVASSDGIMIYKKEGGAGFVDRNADDSGDTAYDYLMLSAPIPFPKTAVYEATQIEPILESDLYAQTNYNFVVDFGRQTSGDQKTDAGTTSIAKPAANVGMQNITYVQVKMSGTTAASKTVGLDLYSYNVWYNAGEIGSR